MVPIQIITPAVALLTAVIGFYVTTVVEEIRSGTAIVYNVTREDNAFVLSLRNVSRERVAKDLRVGMQCAKGNRLCFAEGGQAEIVLYSPVAAQLAGEANETRNTIDLRVTLIPGARIGVRVPASSQVGDTPLFVYFPPGVGGEEAETSGSIVSAISRAIAPASSPDRVPVMFQGGGITALLLQSYFPVMAFALVGSFLTLMVIFGVWIFGSFFGGKREKGDADEKPVQLGFVLVVAGQPGTEPTDNGKGAGGSRRPAVRNRKQGSTVTKQGAG